MPHDCPTCNERFDTHRGLAVHHAQKHGEKLPNRVCACCGDDFYCTHERKYCSKDCRQSSVSFEGRSNPNYRGARSTAACQFCGSEFTYYSSEKEGLFCSDCVATEDWRRPSTLDGKANPRWSGGKITKSCVICESAVVRYPSEFTSETVLCSSACRSAWLSEAFTGAGHPNWKGGGNESYGKGWNEVRERALERDEYSCVVCSKTESELGRNPDVHHIVPVREFVSSDAHTREEAHRLHNVVSLCIRCHRKADFGKISREHLRALIDG